MPLSIVRHYNSLGTSPSTRMGKGWRLDFDRQVVLHKNLIGQELPSVAIERGDGHIYYFRKIAGLWVGDADINDRLYEDLDGAGARTGWRYFNAAAEITEYYSAGGRLLEYRDRNENRTDLAASRCRPNLSGSLSVAKSAKISSRKIAVIGAYLCSMATVGCTNSQPEYSSSGRCEDLDGKAIQLVGKNKAGEAGKVLDEAIALCAPSAARLTQRGVVYFAEGKQKEAESTIQSAIELAEKSGDLCRADLSRRELLAVRRLPISSELPQSCIPKAESKQ